MSDWVETVHRVALAGFVKDDDGIAVARAIVTLRQSSVTRTTSTAHDGAFWFEDVSAGPYEVTATSGVPGARRRGTASGELPVRDKQTGPLAWVELTCVASRSGSGRSDEDA